MTNLVSKDSRTIFDVGANCGVFSAFAAIRCPSAKVFAFEPSTDLIPLIKKNCQGLNVSVLPHAVSEQTETKTLFVNPNSQQTNSLNADAVTLVSKCQQIEERTVLCTSLDDFAAKENLVGIDILKVDVQGFEGAVFRGGQTVLRSVKQLFVESTWMDIESVVHLIPLAKKYGFRFAAVVNPVYLGADLLLSKEMIKKDENTHLIFDLDSDVLDGSWVPSALKTKADPN